MYVSSGRRPQAGAASAGRHRWWTIAFFAAGLLGSGMGVAALAMLLRSSMAALATSGDGVVPSWVFWAVWLVIYPAQGVATALVWQGRAMARARWALLLFAVAFIQNLTFWLSNSLLTTALIDTLGLGLAYAAAWAYGRCSRAAAWWLLPWLVWMPLTTIYKWISVALSA